MEGRLLALPTSNFLQVLRLIQLAIRNTGVTFEEIERELGIPRKKIYEYTDALEKVGVPPFDTTDFLNFSIIGNRVYVAFPLKLTCPVNLTQSDVLALLLALEWAEHSKLFERVHLEPIRRKIRRVETTSGVHFDLAGIQVQVIDEIPGKHHLPLLSEAIRDERLVSLSYFSQHQGALTERTVAPDCLYFREGYWYVRVYQEIQEELTAGWRTLRLDRIRDFQILEQGFRADDLPDQDLRRRLILFEDGNKTTTRTLFYPRTARYIRESAKPEQIEEQAEGCLIFSYEVVGFPYFRSFVLQYGSEAEVLAPEEYRQALVDQLNQLLQKV
jgi:predicted DNA-binding transcriptional regulator YafY